MQKASSLEGLARILAMSTQAIEVRSPAQPTRHPTVNSWISDRQGHPMCEPWVIREFVDSYEEILAPLVQAAPTNLALRRKAFKAAGTLGALIEQRSELLAAALVLRCGLLDMFGVPYPDLLCGGRRLGVEVGSRSKDDVQALHRELEARLVNERRDVRVHLVFAEKPLRIPQHAIRRIVEDVTAAASLDGQTSRHFDRPLLRVDLFSGHPGAGPTVVYGTGFELADHLAEAEREIGNLLERKQHQGRSVETILLLDISRI